MSQLVLVRHGRSIWNAANRFTGWVDVPLDESGINEARHVGNLLKDIEINFIFSSMLIRAQMTALISLSYHNSGATPILVDTSKPPPQKNNFSKVKWNNYSEEAKDVDFFQIQCDERLNERYYGALAGLNKDKMRAVHGFEQVQKWRRSWDVSPPSGESLKETVDRVKPFFAECIVPKLESSSSVVVFAHGNSLRGIVKIIENIADEEISSLEIPTGVPWKYNWLSRKSTPMAQRIDDTIH